jgi:hypothetical protein
MKPWANFRAKNQLYCGALQTDAQHVVHPPRPKKSKSIVYYRLLEVLVKSKETANCGEKRR